MSSLFIDLTDMKTEEVKDHQEDKKPGILHDGTTKIVAEKVDANNEDVNSSGVKMENDLENTTKHENNLAFHETEQDFEIKSENVQQHHETIDAKLKNEEITSYICGKDLYSGKNSSALNNRDIFPNLLKAIKSENYNDHLDVEGDVIKVEIKVENDSETVECKRISAEHEVLNMGKTAKGAEIVNKPEGNLQNNGENVSNTEQCKSLNKKESVTSNGKIFQCDICAKTFKYNANLKMHHRSHTGEKPFECQTCNKAFSQLHHLKTHERIHTGEKPFECKTCKKCFLLIKALKVMRKFIEEKSHMNAKHATNHFQSYQN